MTPTAEERLARYRTALDTAVSPLESGTGESETSSLRSTAATAQKPRSPVLLTTIVVLVLAAAAALATRFDEPADTGTTTTLEPSTSTPVAPQMTAPEAFRIIRQSQAAVGNMDTLAGPLIRDCMAAKGFAFIPNSTLLITEQTQNDFLRQRYPEPRQQGGAWGYYFDSASTAANSQPMETPSPDADVPGYGEALQGTTVLRGVVRDFDGQVVAGNQVGDGCAGQAMTTIFGSPQAYITFFTMLGQLEVTTGSTYLALRKDPDYIARNQSWSQCMKTAGFDYATIFDPQNRDWPSPRPASEEQQVAEADSVCQQGRHLTREDLLVLEERALTTVLVDHPIGDLTEFDRQVQALIAGRSPSTNDSRGTSTTTSQG